MRALQTAVLLGMLGAMPFAHAQSTVPVADQTADAEEALDSSLKSFGFLSGLARGCAAPEQRAQVEREALELSAVMSRLFGTDRAFLYSSGFGYGTAMKISADECAEVVKQYGARVAKFRDRRGGTP